jgi:hypothetical protein
VRRCGRAAGGRARCARAPRIEPSGNEPPCTYRCAETSSGHGGVTAVDSDRVNWRSHGGGPCDEGKVRGGLCSRWASRRTLPFADIAEPLITSVLGSRIAGDNDRSIRLRWRLRGPRCMLDELYTPGCIAQPRSVGPASCAVRPRSEDAGRPRAGRSRAARRGGTASLRRRSARRTSSRSAARWPTERAAARSRAGLSC